MNKSLVMIAAALLFSCGGGSTLHTDIVEPLAPGLRQCSPSPQADTQDGFCYFTADGKMSDAGLPSGFIFVAADGARYHIFNELPLAYYVDGLSVEVEATLMKGNATFGVGLPVTVNTITR